MKLSNLSISRKIKSLIPGTLLSIFVFSNLMLGCSSAPLFIKSDFEKQKIRSIAVMPVINRCTETEDKDQVRKNESAIEESLVKTLTEKKYSVLSPVSVKTTLNEKEIENLSPANLCSLLNVDAILFSEVFEYSDVLLLNHSIKMNLKMVDAKGDSLWLNNLDDNDKPFISAIGPTLGWGIGISNNKNIPSDEKLPTIVAGVAAAELVYTLVDVLSNETSQSIDGVFQSLPSKKQNE
ncbi:MAG: hypothetical protein LCH54_07685 [Bacteroidetes bacterium]|nr:hypothetical protein [Bacteroidota bacterium]